MATCKSAARNTFLWLSLIRVVFLFAAKHNNDTARFIMWLAKRVFCLYTLVRTKDPKSKLGSIDQNQLLANNMNPHAMKIKRAINGQPVLAGVEIRFCSTTLLFTWWSGDERKRKEGRDLGSCWRDGQKNCSICRFFFVGPPPSFATSSSPIAREERSSTYIMLNFEHSVARLDINTAQEPVSFTLNPNTEEDEGSRADLLGGCLCPSCPRIRLLGP